MAGNPLRPELVYRLLGYAGLALLAVIQLQAGAGLRAACLLAFSLLWPLLWWRMSQFLPALRDAQARGAALAHSVECLLVLGLVRAVGAADWLLPAVSLLGLAGVTALGGLRMLIPCALVLGAFLALLGPWSDGMRWLDGASVAGAVLVSGCLLGLAWQAHVQARRLNARRRQAVRESSELKNHNERLARYLPEIVPPVTREAPLALQAPKEVFVTVAFLDLVGFAAMVASHSVSEVVDVLNDFMALTSRLTLRHGGVLGKFLGDGVLIYFPEDEADRGAVGAAARVRGAAGCARLSLALDPELRNLSRAWRERGLGVQLAVRAGMASGYCALGDWGGQGRLDYTLIGTPVNLASRLQSLATPGCALLCGATAALIAQDPDLAAHLGEIRRREVRGLGSVMMHELSASAKVRAIPLPVRSGRPDA